MSPAFLELSYRMWREQSIKLSVLFFLLHFFLLIRSLKKTDHAHLDKKQQDMMMARNFWGFNCFPPPPPPHSPLILPPMIYICFFFLQNIELFIVKSCDVAPNLKEAHPFCEGMTALKDSTCVFRLHILYLRENIQQNASLSDLWSKKINYFIFRRLQSVKICRKVITLSTCSPLRQPSLTGGYSTFTSISRMQLAWVGWEE